MIRMRVGDFCETGSGGTPSRDREGEFYGGHIPWVKSGELRENTIRQTEEHLTEEALKQSSAKLVPAGSLLIAMYGATVGRVAILGIQAATNQAVCFIKPNPDEVDNRYLFHALQAQLRNFVSRAVGGAQPNISQQIIRDTSIYLPELAKQRSIAAILDKADVLRAKRRQSLAKLESAGKATLAELIRPSEIDLEHVSLGELVSEFRYGTSEKSSAGGWPALRIPNVLRGRLDLSELKSVLVTPKEFERLRLVENDLLFVRTNGNPDNVGRCTLYDSKLVEFSGYDSDQFIYASYLIRARLIQGSCDPAFLRDYLASPLGRKQILSAAKTSAGQFNINIDGLKSIRIPKPPIGAQERYGRLMDSLEGRRSVIEKSSRSIEMLFASLQHRAFRGEL